MMDRSALIPQVNTEHRRALAAIFGAGVIADTKTFERAQQAGLDVATHLQNNDAYRFFDTTSDLIVTGPTGSNVNDVVVILVSP